jgi:hypothetical protein
MSVRFYTQAQHRLRLGRFLVLGAGDEKCHERRWYGVVTTDQVKGVQCVRTAAAALTDNIHIMGALI